jgi:hypothetical protein
MRHAFLAAALLLPGLSSVTFAQTLSTPYGYNGRHTWGSSRRTHFRSRGPAAGRRMQDG